ncbi:phage terminase, small subunit [Leptolyngbya sp. PCC 7375]|nr:phage terminase, small subunit [Leptolyngbya sp. PCC 7375]
MARNPKTGLTDKQELFCREYLKDFNGAAAYVRAGYSEKGAKNHAARLVAKGSVQAYLATLRNQVESRSVATLERTLEEIARVAYADITSTLKFTNSELTLNNSEELPSEVTAAIESVTFNESITESGTNVKKNLKMHNKMQALGLLADFFGIRDDFNKARATLKRYGLALIPDESNPVGWTVENYAPSSDSDT